MRTTVLATVLGLAVLDPYHAVAQHTVASDARIVQVQPTATGVRQAQAAKGGPSAADVELDKEIQRAENELREKLIICRRC